jgi:hypothetical protein
MYDATRLQVSALKIDLCGISREAEPPDRAFPGGAWEREKAFTLHNLHRLVQRKGGA